MSTIQPIFYGAIGFGDSVTDLERIYRPKHNGVELPKTNVEKLLRLRCEEFASGSNDSNVQALCRKLVNPLAERG